MSGFIKSAHKQEKNQYGSGHRYGTGNIHHVQKFADSNAKIYKMFEQKDDLYALAIHAFIIK